MNKLVSVLNKTFPSGQDTTSQVVSGYAMCLSLLAVTAFLCVLPLFVHQTLLVSHDINVHIFQADQFYKSISTGILFPKWVMDANKGYGAANFVFYSPFSYYVVALFHIFLSSTISSLIAAIWLSFFLSGAAMFFAGKKVAGNLTAFICAVIYQVFPFHIFDLYLRGTFAELFAYAWFPLVFYFLWQIYESNNNVKATVGLGVSYAGLILTHLVSGYMFTIILLAAMSLILFTSGGWKKSLAILGSIVFGFGLSSFFLLPVIFERKFVQIDYIFEYVFSDFRKNFLFLPGNLKGAPGLFHVPVHIMVVLEVALFLLVLTTKNTGKDGRRDKYFNRFLYYLFPAAFLLTTPLSRWVWDFLPGLKSIQFPWRWVSVMEVALVFLIMQYLIDMNLRQSVRGSLKNRSILYIISILALISVITIAGSNRVVPVKELNSILYPETAGYYPDLPKEYTPVWATGLEMILKKPLPLRISVLSGDASTSITAWYPEKRVIDIKASTPAVLRIATFFYPGWVARLANRRVQIEIENNSGSMIVSVPKGRNTLDLVFVDTVLRISAKYISLFSCFILFIFAVGIRVRKLKF